MKQFKGARLVAGLAGIGLMYCSAAHANDLYFAMPSNLGSEVDTVFVYGAAGITGTVTSPNGFSSPFTVGAGGVT